MHIHYLQHEEDDNSGSIGEWAGKNGYTVSKTELFKNEELPSVDQFDLLIVPGGTMNVDEEKEFPWLKKEKEFLKEVIKAHKKIVGICLGSQLLAEVLGARVSRCKDEEIGWFPVELNDAGKSSYIFKDIPDKFLSLHWHSRCFELPQNAIHLAGSEGNKYQAFIWQDHVLALQFHLEFTPEIVKDMLNELPESLNKKYVQTASQIHCVSRQQYDRINSLLEKILNNFVSEK